MIVILREDLSATQLRVRTEPWDKCTSATNRSRPGWLTPAARDPLGLQPN